MKKFIKILLYSILIVVVLLFTAPFLFKSKIISVANEQLEQNLNAHASFSNIKLSLFRNFPNLNIRIENLNVTGIDEFEGDTLADIKTIELAVNLISAIKMENIEIKRIIIDRPYINAIVLKDGKANWDIAKESAEETPEDTTTSEFTTKISLKLFSIERARINYTDYSSPMQASLENLNFKLTGDLAQDESKLVIDSRIDKLTFVMDGMRYLKNALIVMHFDVDANLKESNYILKENQISINELTLGFEGSVGMPESGDIITNLTFATKNTDFKTLLSLIPAIYMQGYEGLKTTGSLTLNGKISGAVTETATPNADLKLIVSNATFAYPDLPKSARDIQIDVDVHYDGTQMDNTTVDINKFHIDLGGNPIDMKMNLRTPISDPFTNGTLSANLDLASLSDVIQLDSTEMKGKIQASLDWMGKLSSIENERYEEFKAEGAIEVTDLYYNSPDVPKAFILNRAAMSFSPRQINLGAFDAKMGASDFKLQGKLTNYIPYMLNNETIVGELTLQSNSMDLNEFMAEETEAEVAAVDTAAMTVFEVPSNIDFKMKSNIDKLLYDKLLITNLEGIIRIKDSRMVMENLSLNMLDGALNISGEYNTQDLKNPTVDMKFNATNIDIPMAAEAFSSLVQMAPIAKKATGKISMGMTYNSLLTQEMSPVMNSIIGKGEFSSKQIGLKSSESFTKVGKALKTDKFDNMVLNDLTVKFEISGGKILVEPFETKMGDVNMLIAGEQSLDNTMNYGINFEMPSKMLGLENEAVNNLFSSAASKGVTIPRSETVNILARVSGPMNDPKVTLDLKDNVKKTGEAIKEELKEKAKEIIDTKKEEVKASARAEADKILKEAEKQAATVKAEAKKAADVVRTESNTNADKLVKEAKNPVAKAAAKTTADKMKKEGEKKALLIESEANTKADKIIKDAKVKSDNLLK